MVNEDVKKAHGLLPEEDKYKIRDIFIELLKVSGEWDYEVNGLKVDNYLKSDHPEVLKIIGEIPYNLVKQKSTKETKKMWTKIKKLENKMGKKLQKKALMDYFRSKGAL